MASYTLIAAADIVATVQADTLDGALAKWLRWRKRRPTRKLAKGVELIICAKYPMAFDDKGKLIERVS